MKKIKSLPNLQLAAIYMGILFLTIMTVIIFYKVIPEIVSFIAVGISAVLLYSSYYTLMYRGKPRNMTAYIESLTVDDFTFSCETVVGIVNVDTLNNSILIDKLLKLDSSYAHRAEIKFEHTGGYSDYNFIPCPREVCELNEELHQQFQEIVKCFTKFEVEVYVLTADIARNKLNQGMSIIINYPKCDIRTNTYYEKQNKIKAMSKFVTKRYNILNLITDKKPYSTSDYEEFVEQIKARMRKELL